MYVPRTKLQTPQEFNFPHTPYNIQQDLMQRLYEVLEEGSIGIFESPTGTGKSLTLTCGALRWLEDHEELVKKDLQQRLREVQKELKSLEIASEKANDWISAKFEVNQQKDEFRDLKMISTLLDEHEQRLKQMKQRQVELKSEKLKTQAPRRQKDFTREMEEDFLQKQEMWDEGLNEQNNSLNDSTEAESETKQRYKDVKIFFCSRTHSQLAQVVREVKKTAYGKRIRCISLASRQQLCIHPQVRILSSALINEKCLDMSRKSNAKAQATACDADGCAKKKSKTTTADKCPFKSASSIQQLAESALCDIKDIEELVSEAEYQQKSCPYYASREAIADAQLIMLPYQMLLHKRVRQQSGIDLKNSIIIIDEAHNLLDSIAQLHGCELNLAQLLCCQKQISSYKMFYIKRFSNTNLLRINQLLFVIKRLIKLLQKPASTQTSNNCRMLRTYELSSEGDFFNIDLFQLMEFCEQTRFAQKVQGFALRQAKQPQPNENSPPSQQHKAAKDLLARLQQQQEQTNKSKHKQEIPTVDEQNQEIKSNDIWKMATPIRPLLAFIESLTENSEDGRILMQLENSVDVSKCLYKYILLKPEGHFQDILQEARAIIIAGGTMRPTEELTSQLFAACSKKVHSHFYDHVVSASAVLPLAVAKGPNGKKLCFNYQQRNSQEMLTEFSMLLQNVCSVIPAGVVCFFPSYDYLEIVYNHLSQIGALERIQNKKVIYKEPRSSGSENSLEQMLTDYAESIKIPKPPQQGALLLSVVGGKLSEGLNFADDLGRAVIVVGLPYPSRHSPELQERMKHLDGTLGAGAGNEYYENLCMKAVNQCIGRSVRHISDYACVLLLDERYASERIQKKLPQWIGRGLQLPLTFGAMQGAIAKFFKSKKNNSL